MKPKKSFLGVFMIALLVAGVSFAQDAEEPNRIFETIILTPDYEDLKTLGENLRKHNQTYHAAGTKHAAVVYNISSGPNAGKIVWSMGPITYADLDDRPAAGGHDEDWRDSVMPYIESMETAEYWSTNTKLSNLDMLDGDISKTPLLYIRYHNVAAGEGHQVGDLLEKMSEAVKGMEGDNPFGFYANDFRQGYAIGRHIATVSFMKNWAELDEDWKFKEAFEKVHGEGQWMSYVNGMDDAFSDSWDEIWSYNKELSGH